MQVYIALDFVKLVLANTPGRLLKDESGVTAIEYGIIAAAIALAIVAVVVFLGQDIANLFTTAGNTVDAIGTSTP